MREKAYRLIAADGRNDPVNGGIGKRLHEVTRSGLGMLSQPAGIAQGVFRFDHLQPELLDELFLSSLVALRMRARASPGEGDGGNPTTRCQLPRFDHHRRRPTKMK